MNFQNALEAMDKGKRVRISSWPPDHFIKLSFHGFILKHDGSPYGCPIKSLKSDEWEIFKEELDHLKNIQHKINVLESFLMKPDTESSQWLGRRIKKLEEASGERICNF